MTTDKRAEYIATNRELARLLDETGPDDTWFDLAHYRVIERARELEVMARYASRENQQARERGNATRRAREKHARRQVTSNLDTSKLDVLPSQSEEKKEAQETANPLGFQAHP